MIALPPVILFDLDDTILAYEAAAAGCWQAACTRHATDLDAPTLEKLYSAIQQQSDWFWSDEERFREGRLNLEEARRKVVAGALAAIGTPNPEAARAIATYRTALHEERITPFPGAIGVLQQLHAAHIRLGLVTNGASDKQRAKINRHNLTPFFDCIVVEGEFGCGKPDTRVFQHALRTLHATPAETWMIGDNLRHDIAPAQSLGITGVWHDFRNQGVPADAPCQPHRLIRSLTELTPAALPPPAPPTR
jgi:putative hydrolase of the HAD superfamily